jgi:hypothetical protein
LRRWAVLLFVVGFCAACAGESALDGASSAASTQVPSTEVTATSEEMAGAEGWSRVPHDETVFGGEDFQEMHSVAVGAPGLVAVGDDGDPYRDINAAVWTSPDGVTWARVFQSDNELGGSGSQHMYSVTAGGLGFVAVGSEWSGGDEDAAVWTSPDGFTWTRVPHDESVFGGEGGQCMNSVAAGGPGLVVVGHEVQDPENWDAAVWISPDGLTWTRVPHDDAVFGGPGMRSMRSVAVGGPGLVAVGWDTPDGDSNAAVWTSPDGLSWTRVPHDEAVFGGTGDQGMQSVTAGGPGLVAVGNEWLHGDSDAAVWTSPDGLTWTRVPHDEAEFGGTSNEGMGSVSLGAPGLVATGSILMSNNRDAAAWTSPDGVIWTRVTDDEQVFGGPGYQMLNSVASTDARVVAVGYDGPDLYDSDAAVWHWAPEQPE